MSEIIEQRVEIVPNTPLEPYVLTAEEIEQGRLAAYQAESDPIFFAWQRGETTKEAWLAKIEEIKLRLSKPIEETCPSEQ